MDKNIDYQELAEFFNYKDKFARFLGIEIIELQAGYAKARMDLGANHKNGLGMAHGGAIFTLADLAFAAASNSYGTSAVAINSNISYLNPVYSGILIAEAKEISKSYKLATYSVTVFNDQTEICALFQGMVYRKQKNIDYK